MDSGKRDSDDRIIWVLVAVGVALRCWQFAGNASLHLDELALVRNVVDRRYADLLTPLSYGQVAPPGFLLVERLCWSIFHSDWSLRLAAFGGAIASVFLFRALVRRALEGPAVPIAIGLFALGIPLILYGAEVKQYSTDVAIAIGLLLLAVHLVRNAENNPRYSQRLGLAGILAVWFSSTAVFVLVGIGAALLLLILQERLAHPRRVIFVVLIPWGVAAAVAILAAWSLVPAETMAYLKEFWRRGFPQLSSAREGLSWPWHALKAVFGDTGGLRYRLPSVYLGFAIIGAAVLWRKQRATALVLGGPLVVTLAAAVAGLYPFADRLVLFLSPVLLIAVAAGIGHLATRLQVLGRAAAPAFLVLVLAAPVVRLVSSPPVYRVQQARPLFEWLAAHRRTGDALFIWFRAGPHFAWYGPRYQLTTGEVVRGGCWLGTPRRFLVDLDQLRGRARVWLVMAGVGAPEANLLVQYADSIGVRREGTRFAGSVPGSLPMETLLYEFGDSTRLRRASAESFPIPSATARTRLVTSCRLGPVMAGSVR
jgi:hypothetical protein